MTEADALAERLSLPRVVSYAEVGSTLDVAHDLAGLGAAGGTLVIADAQTAGRGRMGRNWRSEPGAGIWLTLIERPTDSSTIEILSLRVGLLLAPALDPFVDSPVRVKWPNDLYVGPGKLGGTLIEARWREGRPEWVAIGVGINLRAPTNGLRATALRPGVARDDVLDQIVPAIRAAARISGPLTPAELSAFSDRDFAAGRACLEPAIGIVRGINAAGCLLVNVGSPQSAHVVALHAGSLVLQDDQ